MSSETPGEIAPELLRELRRCQATLPIYRASVIEQICREIQGLTAYILSKVQGRKHLPAEEAAAVLVARNTILQNKRCVLAYLKFRLGKLAELHWKYAGAPPTKEAPSQNLSQNEQAFQAQYAQLIRQYSKDSGVQVLRLQQPPPSDRVFTMTKILDDSMGPVVTRYGLVPVDKNSRLVIRWADAELFVRQGILEEVLR